MTNGSNGTRNSPCPRAPQLRLLNPDHQTDLLLGPIVLISMAVCHDFTKKQVDSLNELFSIVLAPAPLELSSSPSAPPSAPPSELPHPQSVSVPVSARSYPPSPSVKTMKEVKHKQISLRNIQQMRKKHGASKKMCTSWLPSAEICIGWPTKYGGSDMRFSRDEDWNI